MDPCNTAPSLHDMKHKSNRVGKWMKNRLSVLRCSLEAFRSSASFSQSYWGAWELGSLHCSTILPSFIHLTLIRENGESSIFFSTCEQISLTVMLRTATPAEPFALTSCSLPKGGERGKPYHQSCHQILGTHVCMEWQSITLGFCCVF